MLGVGIMGSGGVAELHARALREIDTARLVGVWSRSQDNASRFAERHFLNACIRDGGTPLSTMDDALDAACVLDAASQSIESGGAVSVQYDP